MICGVGINDFCDLNRSDSYTKIAHKAWSGIIERCYSKSVKIRRPTYVGVTVDQSWLKFSNFYEWYNDNYYISDCKLQVDKDLKCLGNKTYCPENCLLVEPQVNNLILGLLTKKGKLPLGVSECKDRNKKYSAQINLGNGQIQLGRFYSVEEAHLCWQKHKLERTLGLMKNQCSKKVQAALQNLANIIMQDISLGKQSNFK